MSTPEANGPGRSWAESGRRADEARERLSSRYGRFYAPMAVAALTLGLFDPFDDLTITGGQAQDAVGSGGGEVEVTHSFGSLFDMASRPAGEPAAIALALMAALILLLVIAAIRVRSAALPASIAMISAVITLMYLTKPATGNPAPNLSDGGRAGLALALATCLLGAVHATQLAWAGRSTAPAPSGGS